MNNTLKIFKEAQTLSVIERKKLIKLLVDTLNTSPSTKQPKIEKQWNGLGSLKIGKSLDHTNLRDFAHD